jgi:protein gp37
MGETTKIAWTDATVNFWQGCTKVSAACDHCYAEAIASRFKTAEWGFNKPRTERLAKAAREALKLERRAIRQGRRIKVFSNSMSDFFDNEVPDEWRDAAMAVIALTPHLDWLVLTKRPKVMRAYLTVTRARFASETLGSYQMIYNAMGRLGRAQLNDPHPYRKAFPQGMPWPLPNLWLGVTAEDQTMWDLRRRDLEETPAARRFVSMEPLLGPIDAHLDEGVVDWVIAGGESGKDARPMHPDWARSLRDQCVTAGVSFFFKQWGEWQAVYDRDVDDPDWRRCPHCTGGDGRRGRYLNLAGGWGFHGERVVFVKRVGKKAAGRLLDGREWNEQPQPFATGGVVKAGPYLAGERGGEFQP